MIQFKQSWPFIRRLIGVLLVIAGLVVSYVWFYRLAPMRHLVDPKWLETHSEKARWLEEQKDYYQGVGSSPDLEFRGDRIGYYGNKIWFLWLANKVITDKSFRVCGCTETALALMSNQHVDSWEEWMKTNQNRTQEEWIRDGFYKYGVSAHLPPDRSDIEPLLQLIGQKTWNFLQGGRQGTNAPGAIPNYVQYNAYRWLRDSGFSPTAFARSNATLIASQDMAIALIKYANWHSAFSLSEHDNLGVLAFGQKVDRVSGFGLPLIAKPWVLSLVYGFIVVSLISGLWLAVCRRRKIPQSPEAL